MTVADELSGLRRGLGRDGQPIPAYQALGLAFRTAAAGAAAVRLPLSPYLMSPAGACCPARSRWWRTPAAAVPSPRPCPLAEPP